MPIAIDDVDSLTVQKPRVVTEVSVDIDTIMEDEGSTRHYPVYKFQRSNTGNAYSQVVRVSEGERVEFGAVIADGPATDNGELALGKNLLVAFMPWEGLNFEDAIIVSQRMVSDDVLTSIHIEEYEVDARDTKL